jgi:hypothetical protein
MFWIPRPGTFALVLFGYCLMARLLSLLPWNRAGRLTVQLLQHPFFSAPVIGRADHGLSGRGGRGGVGKLES